VKAFKVSADWLSFCTIVYQVEVPVHDDELLDEEEELLDEEELLEVELDVEDFSSPSSDGSTIGGSSLSPPPPPPPLLGQKKIQGRWNRGMPGSPGHLTVGNQNCICGILGSPQSIKSIPPITKMGRTVLCPFESVVVISVLVFQFELDVVWTENPGGTVVIVEVIASLDFVPISAQSIQPNPSIEVHGAEGNIQPIFEMSKQGAVQSVPKSFVHVGTAGGYIQPKLKIDEHGAVQREPRRPTQLGIGVVAGGFDFEGLPPGLSETDPPDTGRAV